MSNLSLPVNPAPTHFVTVITGLPRSGTSLMMQMLAAGGLPPFTDGVRAADESNARGYFEHERIKRLQTETDFTWLEAARGRALKVIHLLLPTLPRDLPCRVVLMRRDVAESVASQRAMLQRDGRPGANLPDERLAEVLRDQLRRAEQWLAQESGWPVHAVDYAELLEEPAAHAANLRQFLGLDLNVEAMAGAVDPTMCRHRAEV